MELLQRNHKLSVLQLKRWPICKIMSDTSKSSFSANLTVLIIRKTFWTSYGETLTKPYYDSKDGQFPRYSQDTGRRLQINVSASPTMVIISAIFWSSYGEMFTYQHYDRKDGQFARYCHTLPKNRFWTVSQCLS